MKHTRLALACIMATFTTTPALAASQTMLQFGSFETRDEAEKRLSEVTSKHSAEIGKLTASIREVKLPPDNLTVYRTQAGPVADRAAAQTICAQLANTGDECYIVQTAMAAGDKVDVKPVATAAVKTDMAATETTKPEAPRDPVNRDALTRVSTQMAGNDVAPAAPQKDATAANMDATLDKAVAAQPAADAEINAATDKQVKSASKPGFWSRMNPFSESKAEAKPVVPAAPAPVAAPVEAVEQQALSLPPATVAAPSLQVAATAPEVKTAPVALAATAPAAAPIVLNPPVVTSEEALMLPPPPAPLKAQDRAQLAAPKLAVAQPEPVVAAIATAPLPAPVPAAPSTGMVKVEEAKRVPLTQTVAAAPVAAPVMMPAPAAMPQPTAAQSPSATDGSKTIWAS